MEFSGVTSGETFKIKVVALEILRKFLFAIFSFEVIMSTKN
jgi:hypothetical protein